MPTTLQQKKNYLDILAVFHYVLGGVTALIALVVLAFMGIGLGAATGWGEQWEMEAGCSIVAVMVFALVLVGGCAALNLLAGRALQTRRHSVLVMITSGVNCLNVPLGTLLGIFTLVLISDPEVRWLFDGEAGGPPAAYGQTGYEQTAYGHPDYPVQQPPTAAPPAEPPPSDER